MIYFLNRFLKIKTSDVDDPVRSINFLSVWKAKFFLLLNTSHTQALADSHSIVRFNNRSTL